MGHRFRDNVFDDLAAWSAAGERTALATLINVEPTGPRPAGSQMGIAEDGKAVGFLSGGCVEAALIEEARQAIDAGANRTVRYGEGSPYMDIALPCGSAIDVFIDVGLDAATTHAIADALVERRPVKLLTDLATGVVHRLAPGSMYALDRHDRHRLDSITAMRIVCVFTPALVGGETHDADGSYPLLD